MLTSRCFFYNLDCWFNGVLTQSNWPYINVYNIIKLIQLCSEDFAMMELGLLILLFIIILTLGTRTVRIPKISAYTKSPATRDHLLSCQSGVHRSGFTASGQIAAAELILLVTAKPLRRRPDRTLLLLLQMSGDVHPIPGPATKYTCPVCAGNSTSRGVRYQWNRCSGWVHAKCSGLLNAAQYRRSSDWAWDHCSKSPPPPPTPTQPSDKNSDDSTFNVLQLNTNGIGNKLTEPRVVMEDNKVKVAVIQGVKARTKIQEPLHPELHHSL